MLKNNKLIKRFVRNEGQAFIEVAILLPVLALMLQGTMWFGMRLLTEQRVHMIARSAAWVNAYSDDGDVQTMTDKLNALMEPLSSRGIWPVSDFEIEADYSTGFSSIGGGGIGEAQSAHDGDIAIDDSGATGEFIAAEESGNEFEVTTDTNTTISEQARTGSGQDTYDLDSFEGFNQNIEEEGNSALLRALAGDPTYVRISVRMPRPLFLGGGESVITTRSSIRIGGQ